MTLKNKLELLTTEFTNLKEKILTKLALKDTNLQSEKDNHQETVRQLETTLKENSTNEQTLANLIADFQEWTKELEE